MDEERSLKKQKDINGSAVGAVSKTFRLTKILATLALDLDISGKGGAVLQVFSTAPCFKANSGVQRKDVL